MPKLSKEENLSRANAADAMLAELGMVEAIEKYNLRDCLSATEYFNFAFRFWMKHVKREAKRKRNSDRYKAMHREYLETDQWKARDMRMSLLISFLFATIATTRGTSGKLPPNEQVKRPRRYDIAEQAPPCLRGPFFNRLLGDCCL